MSLVHKVYKLPEVIYRMRLITDAVFYPYYAILLVQFGYYPFLLYGDISRPLRELIPKLAKLYIKVPIVDLSYIALIADFVIKRI